MPASPLQRACSKKRVKQYSSRAGPEAHHASTNPVSCFLWLFNNKTPQNTHIPPPPKPKQNTELKHSLELRLIQIQLDMETVRHILVHSCYC